MIPLGIAASGYYDAGSAEESYLTGDTISWVTLTRGTDATYYDSSGYLQTATGNNARLDYNPSTLAKRGLLVESSKQNLLLQSNTFTNTGAWVTAIASGGTTTGPDNVSNSASTIQVTSGVNNIRQSVATTSGATYAGSLYVKYNNNQWLMIQISDSGVTHRARVWFDVLNGVKGGSVTTGSGVVVEYDVIPINNGWYRVFLRAQNPITTTYYYIQLVTANNSTTAAANGQAIYLYGAQLEPGNVSSYIPTTTSAVTRNADSLAAALYTSESVTEYYRLVSDLSQSSKTINPFSGVSSEADIWIEKFTKP